MLTKLFIQMELKEQNLLYKNHETIFFKKVYSSLHYKLYKKVWKNAFLKPKFIIFSNLHVQELIQDRINFFEKNGFMIFVEKVLLFCSYTKFHPN